MCMYVCMCVCVYVRTYTCMYKGNYAESVIRMAPPMTTTMGSNLKARIWCTESLERPKSFSKNKMKRGLVADSEETSEAERPLIPSMRR